MSKVFEKCILKQLSELLQRNGLYGSYQSAVFLKCMPFLICAFYLKDLYFYVSESRVCLLKRFIVIFLNFATMPQSWKRYQQFNDNLLRDDDLNRNGYECRSSFYDDRGAVANGLKSITMKVQNIQ